MIVALLLAASLQYGDTVHVPRIDSIPGVRDSITIGRPTVVIRTGQGLASVWLARRRDTIELYAAIPDTTVDWSDDFVISLSTGGEREETPGHEEFQWYFRRVLDSSVVYRGRNGRWEAPQGDPDWRLGAERAGGGWTVTSGSSPAGWWLRLRLEPGWLDGQEGTLPAIAFRVYDNGPQGWYAWPEARAGTQPVSVERTPTRWVPVTLR
ncbi:MAG TPA: hypothetical protein VJQ44_08600 [Gemmatimonadales bacterium]|nr:hypothetical protein [Gemmatimonadales bacterium]